MARVDMADDRLQRLRRTLAGYFARPIVPFLSRTPVTPSALTWAGFALAAAAAALIALGHLLASGFVVLFAGLFDTLDGALARSTNRVTRLGAIMDSTLDRLADGVLLLGVLVLLAREGSIMGAALAGAALIASFMVSYIRARAEAAGLESTVGLFTRPERVIVLALGLLLGGLEIALAIIVVLSLVTAGQRLIHVWRQAKNT
jgi:CDP-diacylglycerol--glycerol-3-phosphate 3-phosphatidyltransferase